MPNETETTSMQSDPTSANDAPGAQSYQGGRVGNGFDSVALQYRAMQEAQLLHEETINQLREEVRGQRERLAELARVNPTQKNAQLEVVMLRLSELERKIGEGAPDPLLNEIVHRLAALENSGPLRGMKDPRVDDIQAQIETLRQRVAEPAADSRTDDVVLRIASLEGAFRRAAQSRDAEEVQTRIEALANELNSRQTKEIAELRSAFASVAQSTADAAVKVSQHDGYSTELTRLADRLRSMEQQLIDARSDHRLGELGNQLAALDRKVAEQDSAEIQARVVALEERASNDHTGSVLELIADRVSILEAKLEAPVANVALDRVQEVESRLTRVADSSQLESLVERVSALAAEIEDSGPARRLLELSGHVRGLEARLDTAASSEKAVQDLHDRFGRLEASVANGPSFADLSRLELQLEKVKTNVAEAGPAALGDLVHRLAELESRVTDAESSSRLEDADARLGVIENKLNTLGEPAEIGRRLTVLEMDSEPALDPRIDDVVHRLAALESKPFETLSDAGLRELKESVADLHAELETVSKKRLPLLTELPERLASVETRLMEVLQKNPGPNAFQDQIQTLSDRVETLAARPAPTSLQDPRVSELLARIEWIERNASGASASIDVSAIERRLEKIEEALASSKSIGSLPSGVQAELAARLRSLEDALESVQSRGGADVSGELATKLQKETDRLHQWARGAMEEIAELRERVDSSSASGGSKSTLDADAVETMAVQITTALNNSEAKALRGQMYFVFTSLGVLWALLMYVLFTS